LDEGDKAKVNTSGEGIDKGIEKRGRLHEVKILAVVIVVEGIVPTDGVADLVKIDTVIHIGDYESAADEAEDCDGGPKDSRTHIPRCS
jgi:hypothetical protein